MKKFKGSKTEKNLWFAFAGESQARNKYDYFASKAKKEGYEQIAAIFQETALNEKEHAKLWFKALGGIGDTAANLLAAAAGTAYLYSRAKMIRMHQRQKEYQQIVDQSLQTFAKTIDAKDRYTNGHSIRVAWYSREIARRMGFSPEEQERIYYVALLHDIGKIGIPDQILNKEGRLTEEESKIVRTHPALGGDILKNFTALEGISEGARYHHERYDGKGYCTGKAGKDIPQVARIIGVADSYDAMASDRCYRKAMSQEVIARELRKGSGTQFDPEVVPVMLEMMEDGTAPVAAPPDDPS